MGFSLRQKIGALGYDLPQFEFWLRRNWIRIRNRADEFESAPDGNGVRCCWKWTSDLHLAKVFPSTGRRLLDRALADWPVRLVETTMFGRRDPEVSFIIGHRGQARLPHLLATLRSIASQREINCECIVVEQSDQAEAKARLPGWVRYLHTCTADHDAPFNRSWALNAGARIANGKLLVFHDNDMLVPEKYAVELWRRFEAGNEAINLKRFVFYLDDSATRAFFDTGRLESRARTEAIVQNLEAGGSVAVGRDAFFELGGFDESFLGWGGEDNEFWERATTRKTWPYAYMPIVHLRHDAQPRKADKTSPNMLRYAKRSAMPPAERIDELKVRDFGRTF